MSIIITCECGKKLQTREENAGRTVRCPQCQRMLVVPDEDEIPDERAQEESRPERFEDEPSEDEPRRRRAAVSSGKAVGSLILGLVSFCLPLIPAVIGAILGIMSLSEIGNSAGRVKGRGMAIAGLILAGVSLVWWVGAGLLSYGAFTKVREAATRMQRLNNLKQIGIALMNHQQGLGQFPPAASCSPTGKPLLSWRVAILPYLGDSAAEQLYKEFHQNEPWDSDHNRALLSRMPRVYAQPGELGGTTTHFRVFVPAADALKAGIVPAFENCQGARITQFTDGTSNTFLVVEAREAVPWTKPDEMEYSPTRPVPQLGLSGQEGFGVLFADGSARYYRNGDHNDEDLRAMITRNGGEIVFP